MDRHAFITFVAEGASGGFVAGRNTQVYIKRQSEVEYSYNRQERKAQNGKKKRVG